MMMQLISSKGEISHTKLFSSLGYIAATVIFIFQGLTGTLQTEVWLIYLGIVASHSTASKYIGVKHNVS